MNVFYLKLNCAIVIFLIANSQRKDRFKVAFIDNSHIRKFEEYNSHGEVTGFIIWLKDIIEYKDAIKKLGRPSNPYYIYVKKINNTTVFRYRWDKTDKLGRKIIYYADTINPIP